MVAQHRRRIYTEENAKVVAASWGTELLQFLAVLAILHQDLLKNRLIYTRTSWRIGSKSAFLQPVNKVKFWIWGPTTIWHNLESVNLIQNCIQYSICTWSIWCIIYFLCATYVTVNDNSCGFFCLAGVKVFFLFCFQCFFSCSSIYFTLTLNPPPPPFSTRPAGLKKSHCSHWKKVHFSDGSGSVRKILLIPGPGIKSCFFLLQHIIIHSKNVL